MSPLGKRQRRPPSEVGKKVRKCESCVRGRARWYCASDDEFLFQSCHYTVHSVDTLARRHDRRSLKISSSSSTGVDDEPAWHHGFKRKPRTPGRRRRGRSGNGEIVPDFCTPSLSSEDDFIDVFHPVVPKISTDVEGEIELGEFDFGFESLLGRGVVDDHFFMEGLMEEGHDGGDNRHFPMEEREKYGEEMYVFNESSVDVKLDCGSPWTSGDVRDDDNTNSKNKTTIMLSLNYSEVMSAWSTQGSPWTDGERPTNLDLDDSFAQGLTISEGGKGGYQEGVGYSGSSGMIMRTTGAAVSGDGSREARVSRYREKRRRRLFSKKIRYEVRKLNAEKRPRMKGRFVKRTPLTGNTTTQSIEI